MRWRTCFRMIVMDMLLDKPSGFVELMLFGDRPLSTIAVNTSLDELSTVYNRSATFWMCKGVYVTIASASDIINVTMIGNQNRTASLSEDEYTWALMDGYAECMEIMKL